MSEYWFRYGSVEVSVEIPEGVFHRKLETLSSRISSEVLEKAEAFLEEVVKEAGSGEIAILYDYSGDEDSLIMLSRLVEAIPENVRERVILILSHWRLDPAIGREFLQRLLKKYGIAVKSCYAGDLKKVDYRGMQIAECLVNASTRIIMSTHEPHGVFGSVSLKHIIALGGGLETDLEADLLNRISEVWEKVSSELPMHAVLLSNDLLLGDAERVEREATQITFEKNIGEFDVVLAGCGGHPRDYSLYSIAHVFGLLEEAVAEKELIGIIAECPGGIGSRGFFEALMNMGGNVLERTFASLLKRISEKTRIAFTSSLPKSFLRIFLNGSRGYDSPQELLSYAFRVYGKEARLLIMDGVNLKLVGRQNTGVEASSSPT